MTNKNEMFDAIASDYEKILESMNVPTIVSSLNDIVDKLTAMFDDNTNEYDPEYFAKTVVMCRQISEGLRSVVNAIGEQHQYTMDQIKGGDAPLVNTD